VLVDLERQRRRLAEYVQLRRGDLDLAGGHVRVHLVRGPFAHLAGNGQAPLVAQVVGQFVLAHHDLHHTGRVAQVDERHAAVVPPPGHPAGERHGQAGMLDPQRSGLMGPYHKFSSICGRRSAAGGVQAAGSAGS
jgi:hypothetical protein